jgi:NAD(P)H-hydrate epimerase
VTNPAADLPRLESSLLLRPALVIDGLFGIGLTRPLDAEWVRFIQRLNDADSRVLSVDVPSGLDADSGEPQGAAVQAFMTLTVGAPKQGLLKESAWPYVGRLEIAGDIGLSACPSGEDILCTTPEDFRGFPPARQVATHKGSYGHLAIIAGSPGYHGAAVLAARGAQRAQPGLITVHTLESVYHPIAAQLQAVMVTQWQPTGKLPPSHTAVLLGPGLAAAEMADQMKIVARNLWRDSVLPLVVDASALDWLGLDPVVRNTVRVLTPHPGEAARLLRSTIPQVQANRVNAVREISKRFGNAWVVLKGHQTMIGRTTGEVFVNLSGNPHLAQGGSGDVLSGYIAGWLAQPSMRTDVLKTLRYAVWQHGATADYLQATRPNWTIEDLVEALGNQLSPDVDADGPLRDRAPSRG